MTPRVSATAAALETIDRLRDRYGPVAFHLSGGFTIDVAPGAAEGFSLEGALELHFVAR